MYRRKIGKLPPKKGKGKFPLFCGNEERVIPIFGSRQVIQSNIMKNTTKVNLDAATLDSPSGEEHNVTSHSSFIIPEYVNLLILGLSWSKRIQEKYKNGNFIPKVFSLIEPFASVAMFVTKSIIPEKASFAAKLIHREEMSKSSLENLPTSLTP